MPENSVIHRVSDSAIALGAPARAGSFTALMGLYESNYVRLGWLLGDLDKMGGYYRSRLANNLTLHVSVLDVQRYTTTFKMTYWFEVDGERIADPDMDVRIYHDARLVEAMGCRDHGRRHEILRKFDRRHGSELEQRWMRNTMLNKWLEYCVDLGHRFEPAQDTKSPP
jgi:uncharacterized protein YqiB (DUF1249 family)